jgi:hypothetical protein
LYNRLGAYENEDTEGGDAASGSEN